MQIEHRINNYQILADDGEFHDFSGILETTNQKTVKINFIDGSHLVCTLNHLIKSDNINFKQAKTLKPKQKIFNNQIVSISLFKKQTVFDILNVDTRSCYKTNKVISHNCLFIDEIAFLNRRIQEEMWASIAPSLSTGGKFILTSTPNGDSDLFATLWRGANSGTNSFKPVKALWHQHPDRDEKYYEEMKGKLGPVKVRQELDCLSGCTSININNNLITMEELYANLSKREFEN